MDYIFTPLSADRFVVESTLKFVTMFRDRLMTTGQAKDVYKRQVTAVLEKGAEIIRLAEEERRKYEDG